MSATRKDPAELRRPDDLYAEATRLAQRGLRRYAKRALPLLRAAIEGGHPMAAHALATWYFHGIGVRKNFRKGVELETLAARHRIPEAVFNLAYSHETGKGAPRDPGRAFRLYSRAAKLGDVDAMEQVARCVFYGIGTTSNKQRGRNLYERALKAKEPRKTKTRR